MLEIVLILSVLIWCPIIFFQMSERGFIILLAWLLVAPVVTNVVAGDANPFFRSPQVDEEIRAARADRVGGEGYARAATSIRLKEILEPNRIMLSALFAVLLIKALPKKNKFVPLDTTEICMAIFSVLLIINVLMLSRRVAFGLRTAVDAFIIPFLAYYITRRLVVDEDHLLRLTRVFAYLGIFIIFCCLIERLAHSQMLYRLGGPFAGPVQLFLVLMVIFYTVLSVPPNLPRCFELFILYLTPVVTLLTWSRGYWLGFLTSFGAFLFFGRRFIRYSRKLGAIGLTLICAAIAIVAGLTVKDMVEERVVNTRTVEWRLAKWDIALQETLKHPIGGIGFNNLRDVFGETTGGYTTAHNSFISLVAELGILGLLAYFAVIISLVSMGLRLYRRGPHPRDRWRGIAVISILLAYQTAAMTITVLYTVELSQLYVYVFMGAIAGAYGRRPLREGVSMFPANPRRMAAAVPVQPRQEVANFL